MQAKAQGRERSEKRRGGTHANLLHATTHLVMNLAEVRRGERQTFELGAEGVRKRRG